MACTTAALAVGASPTTPRSPTPWLSPPHLLWQGVEALADAAAAGFARELGAALDPRKLSASSVAGGRGPGGAKAALQGLGAPPGSTQKVAEALWEKLGAALELLQKRWVVRWWDALGGRGRRGSVSTPGFLLTPSSAAPPPHLPPQRRGGVAPAARAGQEAGPPVPHAVPGCGGPRGRGPAAAGPLLVRLGCTVQAQPQTGGRRRAGGPWVLVPAALHAAACPSVPMHTPPVPPSHAPPPPSNDPPPHHHHHHPGPPSKVSGHRWHGGCVCWRL